MVAAVTRAGGYHHGTQEQLAYHWQILWGERPGELRYSTSPGTSRRHYASALRGSSGVASDPNGPFGSRGSEGRRTTPRSTNRSLVPRSRSPGLYSDLRYSTNASSSSADSVVMSPIVPRVNSSASRWATSPRCPP